jgi:hypothetical protein
VSRFVTLYADRRCKCCHGRGVVYERHAPGFVEPIACECATEGLSDADAAAVERGAFTVLSADEQPETAVCDWCHARFPESQAHHHGGPDGFVSCPRCLESSRISSNGG